jgi:hypothetical protein
MEAMSCLVCGWANEPGAARCEKCGWEIADLDFLRSLTGLELTRYQERRELARSRWTELRRYDQSPRRDACPEESLTVEAGGTSSLEMAIGGSLL